MYGLGGGVTLLSTELQIGRCTAPMALDFRRNALVKWVGWGPMKADWVRCSDTRCPVRCHLCDALEVGCMYRGGGGAEGGTFLDRVGCGMLMALLTRAAYCPGTGGREVLAGGEGASGTQNFAYKKRARQDFPCWKHRFFQI